MTTPRAAATSVPNTIADSGAKPHTLAACADA